MTQSHNPETTGQTAFSFLFRTDQGEISRAVWWKGMGAVAAPIVVLTLIWIALEPFATRAPTPQDSISITLIAYAYLLLYVFAMLIASVCFYNLSAKRFRARGHPASCAGLVLIGLLLSGAALWLEKRLAGFSPAIPYAIEALTAAVAVASVIDLGVLPDKETPP